MQEAGLHQFTLESTCTDLVSIDTIFVHRDVYDFSVDRHTDVHANQDVVLGCRFPITRWEEHLESFRKSARNVFEASILSGLDPGRWTKLVDLIIRNVPEHMGTYFVPIGTLKPTP